MMYYCVRQRRQEKEKRKKEESKHEMNEKELCRVETLIPRTKNHLIFSICITKSSENNKIYFELLLNIA